VTRIIPPHISAWQASPALWRFCDNDKLSEVSFIFRVRHVAEANFNIPIRKKSWHQTVSQLREREPGAGLGTLCGLFGYSRRRITSAAMTMILSRWRLSQ